MGKRCFFIGHRDTPDEIYPALQQAVQQHIAECGVTEFLVGHYGRFDHLAAKAVIAAKQQYPDTTLTMLIPYHPAEQAISLPAGFDQTLYPPDIENVPRKFAIIQANHYAVTHSDYLIAYVCHPASNARNLVEYAEKHGVTIHLLKEGLFCHSIQQNEKKTGHGRIFLV